MFGSSSKGGAVGHILPGVVWLSVPDIKEGREKCQQVAAKLAEQAVTLADIDGFAVTMDMIVSALPAPWGESTASFDQLPGNQLAPVLTLWPEKMNDLDGCGWNGSGHYDMSTYHAMIPPHMGQIVTFSRTLARLAPSATCSPSRPFVVLISTNASKAFMSVLAGSAMILVAGYDTDAAWSEILRVCASPSSNVVEAWDRFPPTFSMSGARTSTSLTVKNCLQGVEAGKELRWVDYRSFNVREWHLLREKFDASWLVPGDILALADPSITAQNPRFPGLFDPVKPPISKRWRPTSCTMHMRTEVTDDATTCSPNSGSGDVNVGGSPSCSSYWANDPIDDMILDIGVEIVDKEALPFPIAATAPFRRTPSGPGGPSPATPAAAQSCPANLASWGRERLDSDHSKETRETFEQSEEKKAERSLGGGFPSYFERVGIGQLVRLNFLRECREQRFYDRAFNGELLSIKPCEFPDGTAPKREMVSTFIEICRDHQAEALKNGGRPMLAVHCKGGLGRTGSIIAAYAVQRYGISGEAFHGFARLMRPGVIQTPEQEKFVRGLSGNGLTGHRKSSVSDAGRMSPTSGSVGRLLSSLWSSSTNLLGSLSPTKGNSPVHSPKQSPRTSPRQQQGRPASSLKTAL